MDGVIVDTAKFHFLAWQRLSDILSVPFTVEQNEQLKGVSRVDSLEKILQWGQLHLDNIKKMELMELKNKWYLEYVSNINSNDMLLGVNDFLIDLQKNKIKIGLGSSSKNSLLILEKLGIADFFETIIDGNKIHFSKPHPEVFQKGASELGLQPHEIVVFEDAISGVESAKSGGFYCIGIGDKNTLDKADVVVETLIGMSFEYMNSILKINNE